MGSSALYNEKILFPLYVSVLGMSRKFFLSRVTCILDFFDDTPALFSAETTSQTCPYKAKKVFSNVQGHTMESLSGMCTYSATIVLNAILLLLLLTEYPTEH